MTQCTTFFFYKNQWNWTVKLKLFLNLSWFLGYIVFNLFLFFPDFIKIYYNTVMIYNTRNRSMIQQKVRKKKRPFVMLIFSTVSHRTKQDVVIKKLSYVNVWQWNSESRLVCMQYNISDSQALFWCFVLIILKMARPDTLLVCSACPNLFLALFKFFFSKIKGFVLTKLLS